MAPCLRPAAVMTASSRCFSALRALSSAQQHGPQQLCFAPRRSHSSFVAYSRQTASWSHQLRAYPQRSYVAAQQRRGASRGRSRPVVAAAAAAKGKGAKEVYVCSECGEDHPQWQGKCRSCNAWNTLVVFRPSAGSGGAGKGAGGGGGAAHQAVAALESFATAAPERDTGSVGATEGGKGQRRSRAGAWVQDSARPERISDVAARSSGRRWRRELPGADGAEVSRVLGGGVVPGSMVLMTGDPGVGKSTLLLQVAAMLAEGTADGDSAGNLSSAGSDGVLYVSAEESQEQVAERAKRLGLADANILLLNATRLEAILECIVRSDPVAVIVDSIQTVYLDGSTGSVGSVSQVRECATALLQVAKRENVPVFLVGHVTKSGEVAGPRVLEHIVDVVLYLEGEKQQTYRLLRSTKNRYGPTDEVGVFSMGDAGFAAVLSPSQEFMSGRVAGRGVGACVGATVEGSRPLLLEVQALTTPVVQEGASTTIVPIGCDYKRLQLLLGILNKHTRLNTFRRNVFVNVVAGLQMTEPSTDLPIAMAIASSVCDKPVPRDMVFFGEIGLAGELRSVRHVEKRLAEAAKLGFRRALVPERGTDSLSAERFSGLECIRCSNIKEAMEHAFGDDGE